MECGRIPDTVLKVWRILVDLDISTPVLPMSNCLQHLRRQRYAALNVRAYVSASELKEKQLDHAL